MRERRPRPEYGPWRLQSTTVEAHLPQVGGEVDPFPAPAGGRRELSGDGLWLTTYGPAEPGHRAPIIEVYVRSEAFRPRRPLS